VLIKVAYAGINRHDCGQRARGHGPKDATDIPGLEVSGEIAGGEYAQRNLDALARFF
jgi:NADPH2:quinone reductase